MNVYVDLTKIVPAAKMAGDDEDDSRLLKQMLEEAKNYVLSFTWCEGIEASYFGLGVGGVVAVFLFRITHSRTDVDDWVWVVVGDLPPAFITCENAPNAACALDGYIGAMKDWVDAIRRGVSVSELIPVNAPATPEYADMLESRLQFLRTKILSCYQDDLKA